MQELPSCSPHPTHYAQSIPMSVSISEHEPTCMYQHVPTRANPPIQPANIQTNKHYSHIPKLTSTHILVPKPLSAHLNQDTTPKSSPTGMVTPKDTVPLTIDLMHMPQVVALEEHIFCWQRLLTPILHCFTPRDRFALNPRTIPSPSTQK